MKDPKDQTEFKDPDRTVIRPNPGGRLVVPAPAVPNPLKEYVPYTPLRPRVLYKTNPLAAGAQDLIQLASRLRREVADPGSLSLRDHCLKSLEDYQMGLKAMGLDDKTQSEARYCLAAFIDEFVLQTPWGAHGPWAKNSLLETLHQESWGGERVFDWIEAWLEQPTIYGHQLEYSLLLLRMGFRGKYGVIHDGDAALEPLKKRIEHALELPPVDRLQGLSSGIVGHVMGSPKSRPTPFWVLFSWTGLALCLVMIVLMTRLGQRSETLMATVMSENPHPPAGSH